MSCCPSPPPCCCHHPQQICQADKVLGAENLHEKLSMLTTEVESTKNILNDLTVSRSKLIEEQPTAEPAPDTSKTPESPQISPDTIVVDVHESPRDISISSIEEFLPTHSPRNNLNSHLLTNQL
jgi:hypothetical protein